MSEASLVWHAMSPSDRFHGGVSMLFSGGPSILQLLDLRPVLKNDSQATDKDTDRKRQIGTKLCSAYKGPWAIVDLKAGAWVYTATISACCKAIRAVRGTRACVVSDVQAAASAYTEQGCVVYLCHAGIIDFALPIRYWPEGNRASSEICGAFIGGQYRPGSTDFGWLMNRAKAFEIDPFGHSNAFLQLPPLLPVDQTLADQAVSSEAKTQAPAWNDPTPQAIKGSIERFGSQLNEIFAQTEAGKQGRVGFDPADLSELYRILQKEAEGFGILARFPRIRHPLFKQVDDLVADRRVDEYSFLIDALPEPVILNSDVPENRTVGAVVHRNFEGPGRPTSQLIWIISAPVRRRGANGKYSVKMNGREPVYMPIADCESTKEYVKFVRDNDGTYQLHPASGNGAGHWRKLLMEDVALYWRYFAGLFGQILSHASYHLHTARTNDGGNVFLETKELLPHERTLLDEHGIFHDVGDDLNTTYFNPLKDRQTNLSWWDIPDKTARRLMQLLSNTEGIPSAKVGEVLVEGINLACEQVSDEPREASLRGWYLDLLSRVSQRALISPGELVGLHTAILSIPVSHAENSFDVRRTINQFLRTSGLGLLDDKDQREA